MPLERRTGGSGNGPLAACAKSFDPSVSMIDILQAMRNAWVACGLQAMFGKPVRLTPGIFAYSMLYPYSDNFLDDGAVSREAKLNFSDRFQSRLEGLHLSSISRLEGIVWDLVGMTRSRMSFHETFIQACGPLVLAIHHAQTRSIDQRCIAMDCVQPAPQTAPSQLLT